MPQNDSITSRLKLRLDTQTDIMDFVHLASTVPTDTILNVVDGDGMCVSARSLLGMLYAKEFKHMWLESNSDKIHTIFRAFSRN